MTRKPRQNGANNVGAAEHQKEPIVNEQTAVATVDAIVEPKPLTPAMQRIGKSLDNLMSSLVSAANVGMPDLSAYDSKLNVLSAFGDDPTFARAIADLNVQRENAIENHARTAQRAVLADVRETFADQFAAISKMMAPPVPERAIGQRGRPTNAQRSEKTVARSLADLQLDPTISHIGAPLADVAAIGHNCGLTSILANGAKLSAHVKQQRDIVEGIDAGSGMTLHADTCVQLAKSVLPLYGARLQLRDAR